VLARLLLLTLKTKPFSSPETNSSPVPDGNLGHIPQQASQMDPTSRGRRLDLLPLRWDATENGGFTTGKPWLPMGCARHCNVSSYGRVSACSCICTEEFIRVRKATPALFRDYIPLRR
jgi:alpha-glucosidase